MRKLFLTILLFIAPRIALACGAQIISITLDSGKKNCFTSIRVSNRTSFKLDYQRWRATFFYFTSLPSCKDVG